MKSKIFFWYLYLQLFKILLGNVSGGLVKSFAKQAEHVDESFKNFTELAAEHGYESEQHTVVTEDGYILTLFRIPKGKNCRREIRQPPVLIMHGLLMSSDGWIDAGPKAGLAYLISDDCYDLWVGNVRGNHYSRRHLRLKPDKDPAFWQFSLNEVGVYDLPAIIDYILGFTGSKKLNYIGFSQSGGSVVIMCSERSGYCDKVRLAILLNPSSKMKNTKSQAFRLITNIYQFLEPYLYNALDLEALPLRGQLFNVIANFCQNDKNADEVCRFILNLLDSHHPKSITVSTIRTLTSHFPAGTSVKNLAWFSQALNADAFQNYDYGPAENLRMYGSTQPHVYNISATTAPVLIIHGKNDHIVSPKDVESLKDQLPNVLELFYVEDPLWNHLDVPYSRRTRKMIFPKISEYLFKYSNNSSG